MRVLFVAMAQSVHTARWINQLSGLGWDVHLFPAIGWEPHPALRDVTIHGVFRKPPAVPDPAKRLLRSPLRLGNHASVRQRGIWLPFTLGARVERAIERRFPAQRARQLARTIRRLRPDIVHSHELNQAGRLTLEAKDRLGDAFPRWVASCWGSDLYLFGRLPEEAVILRRILGACDYFAGECRRDIALARSFGFTKEVVMPMIPVGGGFALDAAARPEQVPPSARRVIALKGYQGWAGRALVAIKALRSCGELLRGYTLALYSVGDDVVLAARLLAQDVGLELEVLPHSSHERVLSLHGRARLSIGLSISDGIPASVLEAMTMGSFPVQSETSAADEWLTDGVTGLLVPPEDPEAVARALRRALTDDALVDRAAPLNAEVVRARLDERVVRPQVIAAYERIAAAGRRGGA